MTTDDQIVEQLQKINHRLDQLTSSGRIMGHEFMSGLFRSFGYAIGTSIIILISVYFLSKMNLGQVINNYVKQFVPKPVEINVPFSQLLPGQL